MVLTSHDQLGTSGRRTGFWLEEFAAPYYAFKDAGGTITLASPKGGYPPVDPKSNEANAQTEATNRFRSDKQAQTELSHTIPLANVSIDNFDALFYPGGHGPLWDLVDNSDSIVLIEAALAAGKAVAAVCHAPGGFKRARQADGTPLVRNRAVTGFSNSEEEAVGLTEVVPFLVEDMLKLNGGKYSRAADWQAHVVVDGDLITGQNPASSEAVAHAVLKKVLG